MTPDEYSHTADIVLATFPEAISSPVDYKSIIDNLYNRNVELKDILERHSRSVAELALDINHSHSLGLDDTVIRSGAMLHDIGIIFTDAPGIKCHGHEPYIAHGLIGAKVLIELGAPLWVARVAALHTGAGLTRSEIVEQGLPLPLRDFLPVTVLEQLICYADKFYSKSGDMKRKDLERVRRSMARHGAETLARFENMHRRFAI